MYLPQININTEFSSFGQNINLMKIVYFLALWLCIVLPRDTVLILDSSLHDFCDIPSINAVPLNIPLKYIC